ncbi:MAG: hypothetical protein KKF96_03795 [Proteobacteria bacterium]|nr:hypothetical protein [Pseudomonadota bacterium]
MGGRLSLGGFLSIEVKMKGGRKDGIHAGVNHEKLGCFKENRMGLGKTDDPDNGGNHGIYAKSTLFGKGLQALSG